MIGQDVFRLEWGRRGRLFFGTCLTRYLAGLVIIAAIATCGCAGFGSLAQQEAVADPEPIAPYQAPVEYEVAPASFESACPTGCQTPGGYLRQGPVFSTMDGVAGPAAAVAHLRQLSAENERLTAENADIKMRLGELQNQLIEVRQSLLANQQECQAARNDLNATRHQLEDWQRLMANALERFQTTEKEHLGALDSAIESIRTAVERRQNEEGDSPATDASFSKRRGAALHG